jgi:hypothetical protein
LLCQRTCIKSIVMKKSLLKFGKVLLGTTGILFLSLLIWANWNARTYTEKIVGDTLFMSYDIAGAATADLPTLEKKISHIKGVSSCSINGKSMIAGVIYYTDVLSSTQLRESLSSLLQHPVAEKAVPVATGGCPVGGIRYFMLGIKEALCFRS